MPDAHELIDQAWAASRRALAAEVRVVFADGSQESRYWTSGDIEKGLEPDAEMQDWMRDPRKTWAHPQDPIIYSVLVKDGCEAEALAWLASLNGRESLDA